MKPLRILLLSNRCPPDFSGGYELRAFQIAGALRQRGHVVDLVTSRFRQGYQGERNDPEWVHRIFHHVETTRLKNLWRYVDRLRLGVEATNVAEENLPALESFLLEREPYDLAYAFSLQRISLAVVQPLVTRSVPILWHAGDSYMAEHLIFKPAHFPGFRWIMKWFAPKWSVVEKRQDFRNVAFVSKFLQDYCSSLGFEPQKSYIISRGIDFPLAEDLPRKRSAPPVFFMACRMDFQKGVHEALAAAALLQGKRPDLSWKLEIAGSRGGQYFEKMSRYVQEHHLSDRVEFLGTLPHAKVIQRMREATAFLSCSTYGEPFAGTIIEALGSGATLIGSDAGSIREVVEPEKSALIYPQGDVSKLSEFMERILDHPDLAFRLAKEGVEVIKARYTLDRILDQTEAAFGEVLEGHTPFLLAGERGSNLLSGS